MSNDSESLYKSPFSARRIEHLTVFRNDRIDTVIPTALWLIDGRVRVTIEEQREKNAHLNASHMSWTFHCCWFFSRRKINITFSNFSVKWQTNSFLYKIIFAFHISAQHILMQFVISSINDDYSHQVLDEIRDLSVIRKEANYKLTLKVSKPRKCCYIKHYSMIYVCNVEVFI